MINWDKFGKCFITRLNGVITFKDKLYDLSQRKLFSMSSLGKNTFRIVVVGQMILT